MAQAATTGEAEEQFEICLQEMARQIKEEFADQVIAHHPLFGTPIRVSDSRVTIEKIAGKLREKAQSYVESGGGVRINLAWDRQHGRWALNGFLLWWKDAKSGKTCRQYAKTLRELKGYVCGDGP